MLIGARTAAFSDNKESEWTDIRRWDYRDIPIGQILTNFDWTDQIDGYPIHLSTQDEKFLRRGTDGILFNNVFYSKAITSGQHPVCSIVGNAFRFVIDASLSADQFGNINTILFESSYGYTNNGCNFTIWIKDSHWNTNWKVKNNSSSQFVRPEDSSVVTLDVSQGFDGEFAFGIEKTEDGYRCYNELVGIIGSKIVGPKRDSSYFSKDIITGVSGSNYGRIFSNCLTPIMSSATLRGLKIQIPKDQSKQ